MIEQAKESIQELESFLPPSPQANFRERLVAYLEESADSELRRKARALLVLYKRVFGVQDVMDESFEDEA